MKKAIVLLSGGLDSATTLYFAQSRGFKVHALIFDYGQRHRKELQAAKRVAKAAKLPYSVVKISLPWRGSALLDKKAALPKNRKLDKKEIPSTYVPARNIIFLSFAASFAEAVGADVIFIGANAVDYSGYPDCRPEFYDAFRKALTCGQKTGVEGRTVRIQTPLIHKTKAQIIQLGMELGVPYHLTWSCYAGGRRPCGVCDSCRIRQKGFEAVEREDPLY